ncbi:MAG: hypothetical protein AUJ97_07245 [Bacteroidetes bacterium CG2_30_32_10]|nr:MAG: hypothetical protein AUJ97_07245 [Bacteroidetes bacterium CG2_30_32_10]
MKKNVLITGGTRGIGKATVYELANKGNNIAFTYNKSQEIADKLVLELSQKYPNQQFIANKCNVANTMAMEQFVEQACKSFNGDIDIVICNAGIVRDGLFITLTDNDWEEIIDTNIKGTYITIRSVLFEFMKKKKGNIIIVSSVAGVAGNYGQTNYSTTKAGIIGLTKSLAKEVGQLGIRVNAVAPGFISTDMVKDIEGEIKEKYLDRIALKRTGQPDEVAKVISFLTSEDSSYITGQVIQIDGGLSL